MFLHVSSMVKVGGGWRFLRKAVRFHIQTKTTVDLVSRFLSFHGPWLVDGEGW